MVRTAALLLIRVDKSPSGRSPSTLEAGLKRTRNRNRKELVVGLTVVGGVPDIADHVLAVHRVRGEEVLEEIWRRPGFAGQL